MKRTSPSVCERLAVGLPRHLGPVNDIVAEALRSPTLVCELVEALADDRPIVIHRASNALKKVQRGHPELLAPHAKAILRAAMKATDLHTRWNLTILVGELSLRGRDRALAIDLMFDALASRSAFLRVFAMNALANFAVDDIALERRIHPILEAALTDSSASIRARARKLLTQLQKPTRA
jgi:hypothetical protein